MSSKYKLIKKYPGSPELGTIAEKGMGIQFTHPDGKVTGASYSGYYDFKTLIQDNPEFWEKVVEYKSGDRVYRIWENGDRTLGIIIDINDNLRFKALEDYNYLGGARKGDNYGLGNYEYKKVNLLFTTSDGVGIYQGDRISTVLLDTMELYTIDGSAGKDTVPVKGFKYFSTKEKAEEYILMNKPCLSIVDIYNHFNGQWSKCSSLMELKKLVKSKL